MLIRCPACEHSRNVNADQVPARAEFATCPKCGHRFRFRALDPDADVPPPPPRPDVRHKDIWDAVDSLQERWKTPEEPQAGQEEASPPADDTPHETYQAPGTEDGQQRYQSAPEPERPFYDPGIPTPWENRGSLGLVSSLYYTVLLCLSRPSGFYRGLVPSQPLTPALFFFLALSIFFFLASMAWQYLILGLIGQEAASAVTGVYGEPGAGVAALPPALLFILPFILALQLVFNAWLIHLGMRLLDRERASFALAFKISAYAGSALVLVLIPFLGPLVGQVAYYVHMVLGCRHAFKLSWRQTATALSPLIVLMVFLTLMEVRLG